LDSPENIWDPSGTGSDRLSPDDVEKYGFTTSLMLIEPDNVIIAREDIGYGKKMNGKFTYKNVE
jgi:hypothetical protein